MILSALYEQLFVGQPAATITEYRGCGSDVGREGRYGMSDIFISYANEDRTRIRPLINALEMTGWAVFWDRTIPTGQTWRQVIGREIQEARSIIVLWTNNSVESDWVQEEAEQGKRRKILFPVVLDNVSPPFGFGSIQAADLVSWDGSADAPALTRLLSDLSRLLGPQPAQLEVEKKRKVMDQTDAPKRNVGKDHVEVKHQPEKVQREQQKAEHNTVVADIRSVNSKARKAIDQSQGDALATTKETIDVGHVPRPAQLPSKVQQPQPLSQIDRVVNGPPLLGSSSLTKTMSWLLVCAVAFTLITYWGLGLVHSFQLTITPKLGNTTLESYIKAVVSVFQYVVIIAVFSTAGVASFIVSMIHIRRRIGIGLVSLVALGWAVMPIFAVIMGSAGFQDWDPSKLIPGIFSESKLQIHELFIAGNTILWGLIFGAGGGITNCIVFARVGIQSSTWVRTVTVVSSAVLGIVITMLWLLLAYRKFVDIIH